MKKRDMENRVIALESRLTAIARDMNETASSVVAAFEAARDEVANGTRAALDALDGVQSELHKMESRITRLERSR